MGLVGRVVTRKFAYGLGGGNSGPRGRPRPAIRGEAICGAESGQARFRDFLCRLHKTANRNLFILTVDFIEIPA